MDREKVRKTAGNLENELIRHADCEDVRKLHFSLAELIRKGEKSLLTSPVDNVPGGYCFLEGGLSKFPGLEVAYYEFKNAVSIGDDEKYNDLKRWAEERQKKIFGKD